MPSFLSSRARPCRHSVGVARTTAALVAALGLVTGARAVSPPAWPTVTVQADTAGVQDRAEAVVEALRQTAVAAQVPGAVVQLPVQAGERVAAGQLLMRLDARAADQHAAAGDAQLRAAQAALSVATQELERQRVLYEKRYIAQAAFERAQAQFQSAQAQAQALGAQATASRTEAGFYAVKAPYAGVLSELPVTLGDMALPGRLLAVLYDPQALRVRAAVPVSSWPTALQASQVQVELDGQVIAPSRIEVLPAVDPATHTLTVRALLPPGTSARPGQFARLTWTAEGSAGTVPRLTIPRQSVVRRAELTAVYVLEGQPQAPVLRQVRLGPVRGDRVEVLAGVRAGEAVLAAPQAALNTR